MVKERPLLALWILNQSLTNTSLKEERDRVSLPPRWRADGIETTKEIHTSNNTRRRYRDKLCRKEKKYYALESMAQNKIIGLLCKVRFGAPSLNTYLVSVRLWTLQSLPYPQCGDCGGTARGGRVRSTTPADDTYIVLSAKRNRRTTAQQVANQFLAASEKQISRKTVARRLTGGGLYARRPVVCVPLTRQHRTARLQWCREHHNWTKQDWACVLFSDESRLSLSSDCRRQLIWRESGTAYRPENIQEKDRYPTCSIMVWAGIMINGCTRLDVVANGTMTGQRYIDEVLLPHVRLFRGAVGDKFVFMDDNATCHRTLSVQDCLDSEGIQRLV
ncbi:transposable element Tcb1 transposase [Trichonephila clavipes]|nr:transposable element Tcb1 transposase [Trichonephila clavipes]